MTETERLGERKRERLSEGHMKREREGKREREVRGRARDVKTMSNTPLEK